MNEIDKKIDELINLFNNDEVIKRYKEIENSLNENEYVKMKIEEFRKYQRKIVIYESKNKEIPKEVNDRYELLYNELLEIPIYNEYLLLQQEINDLIQTVTNIIETELNL